MKFWKSLSGMMTVESTGAAPETVLDAITLAGIPLTHIIKKDELTYQFRIHRRDYPKLTKILCRYGNNWKIIRRDGIYWSMKALGRCPILLIVSLILFFASLYLPSRVFFVTVAGNTTIPEQLILAAAEDCGIRFGASRKTVRSEKVKNRLLSAVPQLQWAGVNTSGCVAEITVCERMEVEKTAERHTVSNLVAERDGYIQSVTVTRGTACVQPGEAVTKGQLLINGYTDCGICIQATRAEGEIFAQTNRMLRAVMPDTDVVPVSIREIRRKYSLLIGKKRINLWKDSRISDTGCGRMYEEYFVSLPGGFQLPVGIAIDRYLDYAVCKTSVSETEARRRLEEFSEKYLVRQMIAGQILRAEQRFFRQDGLYRLESSYVCAEMIGKEQREQIGDIHEQRS